MGTSDFGATPYGGTIAEGIVEGRDWRQQFTKPFDQAHPK